MRTFSLFFLFQDYYRFGNLFDHFPGAWKPWEGGLFNIKRTKGSLCFHRLIFSSAGVPKKTPVFTRSASESSYFNLKFGIKQSKVG